MTRFLGVQAFIIKESLSAKCTHVQLYAVIREESRDFCFYIHCIPYSAFLCLSRKKCSKGAPKSAAVKTNTEGIRTLRVFVVVVEAVGLWERWSEAEAFPQFNR
jgi:hypothetical protein